MERVQKEIDVEKLVAGGAVVAFTDGSCQGYGKPHASAGSGVYFPFNREFQDVSRSCGLPATNQRAELSAILFALQAASEDKRHLVIITDSKYSQGIVNDWGWLWRETGQRKSNMDLVDQVLDAVDERRLKIGDNVEVLRVYSHLASDSKLGLKTFDPNSIMSHPFWVNKDLPAVLTLCNAQADKLAKASLTAAATITQDQTQTLGVVQPSTATITINKVKVTPDGVEIRIGFEGLEEVCIVGGKYTGNQAHLEAIAVAIPRAKESGHHVVASRSKYAVAAVSSALSKKSKNMEKIKELQEMLGGIRVILLE